MKYRDETLKKITDWSHTHDDIRAVLLTSSLVNPLAPVDDLSDLDRAGLQRQCIIHYKQGVVAPVWHSHRND